MRPGHWAHQTTWLGRTVYDVGAIFLYGVIVFVRRSGLAARWERQWHDRQN